jgi:hypothetical protein
VLTCYRLFAVGKHSNKGICFIILSCLRPYCYTLYSDIEDCVRWSRLMNMSDWRSARNLLTRSGINHHSFQYHQFQVPSYVCSPYCLCTFPAAGMIMGLMRINVSIHRVQFIFSARCAHLLIILAYPDWKLISETGHNCYYHHHLPLCFCLTYNWPSKCWVKKWLGNLGSQD